MYAEICRTWRDTSIVQELLAQITKQEWGYFSGNGVKDPLDFFR